MRSIIASNSAGVIQPVQDRAVKLRAFLSSTGNVNVGQGFAITVQGLNAAGTVVSTYSGQTATISIVSSPSGANLTGTTSAVFSNGVATFSDLVVDTTGNYTFEIDTSDGLQPTTISIVTGGRQT